MKKILGMDTPGADTWPVCNVLYNVDDKWCVIIHGKYDFEVMSRPGDVQLEGYRLREGRHIGFAQDPLVLSIKQSSVVFYRYAKDKDHPVGIPVEDLPDYVDAQTATFEAVIEAYLAKRGITIDTQAEGAEPDLDALDEDDDLEIPLDTHSLVDDLPADPMDDRRPEKAVLSLEQYLDPDFNPPRSGEPDGSRDAVDSANQEDSDVDSEESGPAAHPVDDVPRATGEAAQG